MTPWIREEPAASRARNRLPTATLTAALVLLSLVASTPAQAQTAQRFQLTLADPGHATVLPADGSPGVAHVPWTLRCNAPAPAPENAMGPADVGFALEGAGGKIHLVKARATLSYPDCAVAHETSGTFDIPLAADAGTAGEEPMELSLTATVLTTVPGNAAHAQGPLLAQVAWQGGVTAKTPITHIAVGPQKQAAFPIELHAIGNAPTAVHFEVVNPPAGWQPVTPAEVLLDPSAGAGDATVTFVVSTPYHNGPNDDATNLTLRITTHSTRDGSLNATAPIDMVLNVESRGVYIPAPGPALPMTVVAAAGLALRRRHA